ncbi:MAG TPA: hypothetical protein VLK65_08705 [Vicinamibacteria bacterium]|nr:hypothetical protein [Vicinamibacteria bacterium]
MIAGLFALTLAILSWEQPQPANELVELVLDGVIVAKNPANSIALVRRSGSTRARPLRVGQSYGGYVLAEVDRDSVLLRGTSEELRIFLLGENRPGERETVAERVWIRRSFPRAAAERRLEKEIPLILSDTKLTPRIVDGEISGLCIDRIPDGTLLSESGLVPGDVIMSLNGEPLRSLPELWEHLARLNDADELRLVVDRRGEEVRLAYELTR